MINKNATSQKRLPYLTVMFVISGLILTYCVMSGSARGPELMHYIVKVSPMVQNASLETSRLALEESLFQSINSLVVQDTTLTYSKALDDVLPMSRVADKLPGGVVIVVKNYGSVTAHNVQVNATLEIPFKSYKIFSSEAFSIVEEDNSKGILKINIGKLPSREKIQIVILLSREYEVLLTASRTKDLQPPVLLTSQADPMHDIEIMGTQTAVAIYNQNKPDNFLQFQVEYSIDNIQPTVLVSSDEMRSQFYGSSTNTIEERNLFSETFPQ